MSLQDWFKVGGATRGKPRWLHTRRGRLATLGLMGCMAMIQAGCQSGPFANGGCTSCGGFFARATNRILHRDKGCCGSTAVSGGPVEYGSPAVVVPGTIPSYSSGGTLGTAPSNVSPSSPDYPSQLESTPSARPGPAPGGTGASGSTGSGVGRSSYSSVSRPGNATAMRSRRSLSSTPASTTESTARSAPASSNAPDGAAQGSLDDNFLDHLPPLGLPGEVTKSSSSPPAPPAPPASPSPPATKSGEATKAEPTVQRSDAPAEAEFALTVSSDPAPETASGAGAGAGTGIRHFAAVDLRLAGGSGPSEAGLSWLVEKGYRTVLDLRESTEVPPGFIADVARLGLRYVALPIRLEAIDQDHVARFNFEIASGDARPMFFFDSDGSRAGALWYIRRVTVDRVDAQIARREAESLGLLAKTAWPAAINYIEKLEADKANPAHARSSPARSQGVPASSSARTDATDKDGSPTSSRERPNPNDAPMTFPNFLGDVATPAERSDNNSAVGSDQGRKVDERKRSGPEPPPMSDTMVWRPFAAMILTGLSIPLAYWTRTVVPELLSRARASLPAPAQPARSLPRESGA